MRRIFAMGGGGLTMEPGNRVLDELILGLARRPVPRVCFLPTAGGDPLDHITRFHEAFSDLPCEASTCRCSGSAAARSTCAGRSSGRTSCTSAAAR
jgi:peptidase E